MLERVSMMIYNLGAATSWHMWDTKAVFLASAKQHDEGRGKKLD